MPFLMASEECIARPQKGNYFKISERKARFPQTVRRPPSTDN